MSEEIMRISAKGQMTLPISIRKKLNIREGDHVYIKIEDNEIRLKKVETIRPLSPDDPIWKLIGVGESGQSDVSVQHDQYLVQGEIERWKK